MIFRILWTSLLAMLVIIPLQADFRKATIGEKFAGKRSVDSENEENGEEPVEGNTIVYAKARILVEIDDNEFLQFDGTEFKTFGRVRGIGPNNDYEGYWFVDLTAWHNHKRVPKTGVNEWFGSVEKEYDEKWKWKGKPKHLTPPADHLSRCTARAFIIGGDNYHYWNEDYFHQPPPYVPDMASAYADDFSHADADEWECYNCTTPDDELDTPCSKCGGEDRKGGILIENLIPTPSPAPTPTPDPTPAPDPTPDTDDEDTNNDGAINTPTPGLTPTNGSNLAVGGETYELQLVAKENYYYVHWHVKSPSETGIGTEIEVDGDGYGGETEASFSYTFPYTTGTYVITARVYRFSDYTYYDETYTVTVR